jgi:hypothetical protein
MIVCDTCRQEYEQIFDTPYTDQGFDCSAIANKSGVIGYYGSTLVDMEVWKWTTGKPLHVKEGIICDSCIKPLIESGAIVLDLH